MVLKGTDKIRGELTLSSIKKQIGRNKTVHINDTDYWSNDVQVAIKMGYVQAIGKPKSSETVEEDVEVFRNVQCKNVHARSISIPSIAGEIKSGQIFIVKENQLNDTHFKIAMSKNLIKVIGVVNNENINEGHLSDILDGIQDKPGTVENNSEIGELSVETQPEPIAAEVPVVMPTLDTNEELPTLIKEISLDTNSETVIFNPSSEKRKVVVKKRKPKAVNVEKSDEVIEDLGVNPGAIEGKSRVRNPHGVPVTNTAKNAVVWAGKTPELEDMGVNPGAIESNSISINPGNDPISNTAKNSVKLEASDIPMPISVDANEGDPKKSSVVYNPNNVAISNTMKDAVMWTGKNRFEKNAASGSKAEDLVFVDQKEMEAKIKKHPILSKKEQPPQNEEIEFV